MKKVNVFTSFAGMCLLVLAAAFTTGCDVNPTPATGARADVARQQMIADSMQDAQKTPTDIRFSLERHNLIRRAYWVNGMREKALSLPCKVNKPIGYIVLVTGSGAILGRFVVDGKVTSLKQYLTPESEYYEYISNLEGRYSNKWLADVDGCYGDNDDGIFFFTPDGKYIEWKGMYLYSDIPFSVSNPVLRVEQSLKGGVE